MRDASHEKINNVMSNTSLSSLDSGDEIHVPRHAVFRDRANPMEMFDNIDFKSRFRFSKNTVTEMLNIFGHEFQRHIIGNIGIMHNDDFLEDDIPEAAIVIPVVQEDLDTSVRATLVNTVFAR
ncbi:hypothetical protein RN001_005962 [Aquatica leii]|uniref:Uncharacterized protein n=1 Tax=Aquatica leii TaxID=1421715 RepID=A0AAN7SQ13_9COLE|nr:hypothetical protein RN001_005962 [Aquatica leii]